MAARAYWQGQIRLALVSIPVEIYPATKSGAAVSFRQIHEPTGKPIKYEKSVAGVGPQGQRYRFDKHHLVPFGEFIPPGFRWFTDMMNIPLNDATRGILTLEDLSRIAGVSKSMLSQIEREKANKAAKGK